MYIELKLDISIMSLHGLDMQKHQKAKNNLFP